MITDSFLDNYGFDEDVQPSLMEVLHPEIAAFEQS